MDLLSTAEAAIALGLSERRIRQLIKEGALAAQKLGRDYAIEWSALASVTVHGKAGRPPKAKPATKTSTKKPARKK